jgi:hypothetical protein
MISDVREFIQGIIKAIFPAPKKLKFPKKISLRSKKRWDRYEFMKGEKK